MKTVNEIREEIAGILRDAIKNSIADSTFIEKRHPKVYYADQILAKIREGGFMHLSDPVGGEVGDGCEHEQCPTPKIDCWQCKDHITSPRLLKDLMEAK